MAQPFPVTQPGATRALAKFIAELEPANIPGATRAIIEKALVDAIGCGLYGLLTPWAQIVDLAKHLILPLSISSFGGLAGLSRYMRANMLEVIKQDYIMTARAKGLSEWSVIYKHALRNALLPVITILGLSIPGLIGGSVIFETIFAIPGMGQLFYMAVMARDYPTVMGVLLIGAILTLIGNLIADVSYALADPRIRMS